MFAAAAAAAGIPLWLAVATAKAESAMNNYAERWGAETNPAKAALAAGNWAQLRAIIGRAGADISFGYGQQILLYHYAGDRTASLENALAVRDAVFNDPETNVRDMCGRLAANVQRARGDSGLYVVDGDPYLGALLIYNAGSIRTDSAWWNRWAGNVANYRGAISWAHDLVGSA